MKRGGGGGACRERGAAAATEKCNDCGWRTESGSGAARGPCRLGVARETAWGSVSGVKGWLGAATFGLVRGASGFGLGGIGSNPRFAAGAAVVWHGLGGGGRACVLETRRIEERGRANGRAVGVGLPGFGDGLRRSLVCWAASGKCSRNWASLADGTLKYSA